MKPIDAMYYDALGLQRYRQRDSHSHAPQLSVTGKVSGAKTAWQALQAQVSTCTACALHASRTHTVFGIGNEQAELMIIGEAPGFNEDKQGEPFVGRAGQLLNLMLSTIHLTRDQVYITNIVKCRPPENRDPHKQEVQTCTPYLSEQINHIQPKLILALGCVAAHHLLQTKASLESLRSKVHTYADTAIPLIVTYHPAYLLRNLTDKNKSYLDLLFAHHQLQIAKEEVPHGRISTA